MKRHAFLRQAAIRSGSLIAIPFLSNGQVSSLLKNLKDDALPPEKVKDFVVAGHSDLVKVKSLLQEIPTLLYATWDWGGGDFETALEGAGHVGNKEIANYLVSLGARTNLFVLTMLGKTQIVTSFLDAYPEYINARGPHGFTFLHHAQRGGEDSQELLAYFQAKGLTKTKTQL
ncbi:MAG: hypothetical protein ABI416_04030 [Ginsengibacter sp.]